MTRALLQSALEALENCYDVTHNSQESEQSRVVAAIQAHLALPQGEPVASVYISHFRNHLENRDFDYWGSLPDGNHLLFTHPAHTEAEAIIQAITDPENQPSQFGTVPMPTEDTVRLILDAIDNIELRKPLAREIRQILGVNVPQRDINTAQRRINHDAGNKVGSATSLVSRAWQKMQDADALRKAKLRVKLGPGVCLECEGEGEQGGQFTGGTWPCDACGGTGRTRHDRQRSV